MFMSEQERLEELEPLLNTEPSPLEEPPLGIEPPSVPPEHDPVFDNHNPKRRIQIVGIIPFLKKVISALLFLPLCLLKLLLLCCKHPLLLILIAVLGAYGYFTLTDFHPSTLFEPEPPAVNVSTLLKKVTENSTLSTVTLPYSGIFPVTNPSNFKEVLYYVSYDATIEAGINLEEVSLRSDDLLHILYVSIPDAKILDSQVDFTTLDFLWINSKYETFDNQIDAQKLAKEDLSRELLGLKIIESHAQENAKRLIEAITLPLLHQAAKDYTLVFE